MFLQKTFNERSIEDLDKRVNYYFEQQEEAGFRVTVGEVVIVPGHMQECPIGADIHHEVKYIQRVICRK